MLCKSEAAKRVFSAATPPSDIQSRCLTYPSWTRLMHDIYNLVTTDLGGAYERSPAEYVQEQHVRPFANEVGGFFFLA